MAPNDAEAALGELSPPTPATVVAPEQAEAQIDLAAEEAERIRQMVAAFTESVMSLDVRSDAYRRSVGEINAIGTREMIATSEMSNRLLDRPVRAMRGPLADRAPVARKLIELRHTVEELNPARYDLSRGGARRLLGIIPFGDRARAYFDRYARAQIHIRGIIGALTEGRAELERDNAAIAQEQRSLWTEMESLRQYAYMAQQLDESIDARILASESTDPDRARTLREDVLYPVRRRRQEILTQLAVAAQGYAALRVVEKNNHELMRAIQTATTTTTAALRTAVMVAQALTSQRLVTEQLKAVNEVTGEMIESTSSLLRDQTGEVETQATGAGVDVASLQRAWDNVFAALDQIDTYKLRALDAMKVTVRELSGQVERSRAYTERLHGEGPGQLPAAEAPPESLRLR